MLQCRSGAIHLVRTHQRGVVGGVGVEKGVCVCVGGGGGVKPMCTLHIKSAIFPIQNAYKGEGGGQKNFNYT